MFCSISITRDCLLSTDESEDFEYLSAANLSEKLDVIYADVRYKKGEDLFWVVTAWTSIWSQQTPDYQPIKISPLSRILSDHQIMIILDYVSTPY